MPFDTSVATSPKPGSARIFSPARARVLYAAGVVRRGWILILACMFLAIMPALLYLQLTTPRYTATAIVMVEGPDNDDSLLDRNDIARIRMNDMVVSTEAAVLTSTPLARRVIDKLGLDRDPEFNTAIKKPSLFKRVVRSLNPILWIQALTDRSSDRNVDPATLAQLQQARITKRFLSQLEVKPERRSYLISLRFTAQSREKAARIANTIADLYVVDRLEVGFQESKRVNDWLAGRLESLRKDVGDAESAAELYRASHNLRVVSERQQTLASQQLEELNSKLVLARADLAQKQAKLDQVRSLSHGGGIDTAADVLQSPLIQQLREREATARSALSEAQKTYGDRHPKLLGMQADLDQLRASIRQEIDKIAASLTNDVSIATIGVQTLEREIDNLKQQGDLNGSDQIEMRSLDREATANRSLYESFLGRFKRDAEQDRIQRANARLLSPADIPAAPSYPRSVPTIAIALALGLSLGFGLVFALDRLDGAVRSAGELEDLAGAPVLAMIPLADATAGRKTAGDTTDVFAAPRSALVTAFRSLRAALTLGDGNASRRNVIMVASSVPGEGKSFVSLGLARNYAMAGERVLLIDADLHKASLHKTVDVDGARGLIQLLRGEAEPEDAVTRPAGLNIDFIPAGRGDAKEDVFGGPAFDKLIARLSAAYDRIIVDTPPILPIGDGRFVARSVDQVVYLVKWNDTQREAVQNGLKLLREARAPLAGVVLTQVDLRRHATYGYGDYASYYGRYNQYYAG